MFAGEQMEAAGSEHSEPINSTVDVTIWKEDMWMGSKVRWLGRYNFIFLMKM